MKRVCFLCADFGRIAFPPHLEGLPCPNCCKPDGSLKEEEE